MLSEKITKLHELHSYKYAFKYYIKSNRLLVDECVAELEDFENLYFAHDLSKNILCKCEKHFEPGDFIILFGINIFNNSFNVRIYGKIDIESVVSIRDNLWGILSTEKYDFYTYNFLDLYEKQEIMAYEINFYSTRSTPILLQRIKQRLENEKVATKVLGEDTDAVRLVNAIKSNESIVAINELKIYPKTGEINVHINIYADSFSARKIKQAVDNLLIDFTFCPRAFQTSFVPGSGLEYQRIEIIYTNFTSYF